MVCCIAAAFVFGLIVKTLQTVFRRGSNSSGAHPTPTRRVDDAPVPGAAKPVDPVPVEPGERDVVAERTPVGSGV